MRLNTTEPGSSRSPRVEHETLQMELLVRDPATLEVGEERLEPERMLVQDPDQGVHNPSVRASIALTMECKVGAQLHASFTAAAYPV